MPNRVNRLLLSEMKERYTGKDYLIAVGYEGLDITGTNAFRAELANKNMNMTMVKNRIAKIAFKEIGVDGVDSILNGQTAFVVGEDPVSMARTIRDFSKEHNEVVFRGAVIENTVLDEASAKGLADAASKEELQGRIVGAALSGGANLSAALLSPAKNIAGCLKTLVERLEEKESA
ncbi:MAG: 50S ribosomal protein L10 [Planctomycetota bacterium]|jgi:large subunit ribosomal protein L10